MTVMGLDYGSKAVGVALGDSVSGATRGVECIYRKEENKLRQTLARIEEILVSESVSLIVLGEIIPVEEDFLPEWSAGILDFKEKLERRTGLTVCLCAAKEHYVDSDRYAQENKRGEKQIIAAAEASLLRYLSEAGKQ